MEMITAMYVCSNCELSSHNTRILRSGQLHGDLEKSQNCKNQGVGGCARMGACLGQYDTYEPTRSRNTAKQVSLIGELEWGMKQWNGRRNGMVNVHSYC